MPTEQNPAPEKKPDRAPETPRTDLPPEREPYYEGYFGTDEEEGVVREEEESGDAGRSAAEDSAGGDREIS
jgi:hypothetical protein